MMLLSYWLQILLLASALLGMVVGVPPVAHAATLVVDNGDGPNVGFNDPTPVAPVGGNTGTTLGAQRLIAFQRAADIWGGRISSPVTIRILANFSPLTCSATSAVLGSAGPVSVFRDFSGAPVASTWFPVALANALSGSDLDPANDDISATFNSSIGTTCPFPRIWYYGLDGNAGSNIDLVSVVLHELGHGLGFLTFVDLATGAKLLGFDDTYMRNLENHGASPPDYPSMSNAQRVTASTSTGNLHWVGANVRAASSILTAGRVGDHVQMFAPNPQQPGSSVSHWDTALTPDQLLEPIYTVPIHNPVLEPPLFQDIGWSLLPLPLVAAVLPYARSVQIGELASAFGVIINTGPATATSCSVALPLGLAGSFIYQTTDTNNSLTGSPNTPVDIASNATQHYVFGYTPSVALNSVEIGMIFDCVNTPPAPSVRGVNTFILSASSSPTPDIVAIGATASGDGIVDIPGNTATGFFAAAGVNIGAAATITASADDGGRGLPITVSICQTDPNSGNCLSPPAPSTTTTFNSNATLTFSVFAQGNGNIPFDPANNRLFLRFTDPGGVTRGATNVAVRTFGGPVPNVATAR